MLCRSIYLYQHVRIPFKVIFYSSIYDLYVRDCNAPIIVQNFTVHYWIQKGAARNKLVLGVPAYGQSFSLVGHASGLGAPADAGGEPGDETRARGFLAFYEVITRITTWLKKLGISVKFRMSTDANKTRIRNILFTSYLLFKN